MRPDEIEPDEHTEAIREAIQDQRRQQQQQQQQQQLRRHRATVVAYSILYIYHTPHALFL
jgi:hypothetical protein